MSNRTLSSDGQSPYDSNLPTSSHICLGTSNSNSRSRRCRVLSIMSVMLLRSHITALRRRPRRAFHCTCQMIQRYSYPTHQWISFRIDRSHSAADRTMFRRERIEKGIQRRERAFNVALNVHIEVSFRVSSPMYVTTRYKEDHPLQESTTRSHHLR